MSPRPDVSEERKVQIIEAATKVFSRSGYEKARMDDIAEETGVSKGTLYWYFKSKDAILMAILNTLLDRELDALRKVGQEQISAKEQLIKGMDVTIDDFKRIEPLLPLLFEFFSLANRNKLIQKAIKEYFRTYMEVLETIIQRGMDQGDFRPGSPQDVAIAIGAILEGTFLLKVYDPKTVKLEKHMRANIQLLLDGLLIQK